MSYFQDAYHAKSSRHTVLFIFVSVMGKTTVSDGGKTARYDEHHARSSWSQDSSSWTPFAGFQCVHCVTTTCDRFHCIRTILSVTSSSVIELRCCGFPHGVVLNLWRMLQNKNILPQIMKQIKNITQQFESKLGIWRWPIHVENSYSSVLM